ncbi:Phenylacetate-CoA oxygenase/reductase, PaaK subunit [Lunatimonas lonarensis]|uniref:Phenylacetate-CoA oxygenase/reductase, PaaK subunit n=1 Tax=Lunatimonas lonarensis TaxID=1232681 RepID=R7ZMM9_9BACT|nr:ferredoxin--NADP reductase [Lunatimonas lonarensis]EON75356.1 Phenylacetate-CoA oxygenase/reductase, PaaK subunit [Lunatimonas lonarensis]
MLFKLFSKNPKNSESNSSYLTLKVREVIRETSDAVTIVFEQPEPHLEYKPGQFLTVIIEINGKEERRSYSLCTSPYLDPHPAITVKRLSGGIVSNYLNDHIFPGKKIAVMKPLGNFTNEYHSKHERSYGMIAAGSGITPIMGILKSILINEPLSTINLLYGSRSEDQIIFKENLEKLQQQYPGRLEILHQLSKPSDTWKGNSGRIQANTIQRFIENQKTPTNSESHYFLCGPNELMELAKETLLAQGLKKEYIHSESFYKEADEMEEEVESLEAAPIHKEVSVVLEGESYTFQVPPGKTILEAGLDENIDMPYSCQSGLCTACRGRLLSGEVSMVEDAGLSENEIAQGYILCCSSKPKSGEIKISIE